MSSEVSISHYNPGWLDDDTLLANFKARQDEFNFLRDSLASAPLTGSVQHHLLVGQRGAGKTTLLSRLAVAIRRDSALKDHLIALSFPEELYQVKSLSDFWWAACEALGDELERSGHAERAGRLFDQIDRASTLTSSIEQDGLVQLLETCTEMKRRPVMLVDNLDLVIHRIEMGGRSKHKGSPSTTYWAFREALSTATSPIVIGSTVRLSEPFTSVDKAFYDFFLPQRLGKLPLSEVRAMLEQMAQQQDDTQVIARLEERPARIEALYELTGGNPRAIGLVFKLLSRGPSNSAVEDFEGLMDLTTPYYKARFEDLAEQAQIVMHALATRRSNRLSFGHTGAEISTHAGLPTNTVSAQMDLLVREGLVEKNADQGRTQYRIAEQLFRLWLQMRATRRIRQNALGLARYLEALFDPNELTVGVRDAKGRSGAMLTFAVAETTDNESLRHGLIAHGANLLLVHLDTTGGEFEDYVALDDLPQGLAASIKLRQNLRTCHGGGLSEAEQDALLGSLTLTSRQKEASVIALCSPDSAVNEVARLRPVLANERRQLLLESLLEADLPLLFDLRAKGHLRLPMLSPDDAEVAQITYRKSGMARMVWRLLGLRRIFRFKDVTAAESWLAWGDQHVPEASSTEWANVAGSMRLDGCYDAARKALARAFEHGESSRAFFERASQMRAAGGAPSEVEVDLRHAIELDPHDPLPWNTLGDLLQERRQFEAAENALRKAIELDSNYAGPWTNLGNVLQATGRLDAAEASYRKAIQLDNGFVGSWNNLAMLFQQTGRLEEAEYTYRKAIEINPNSADPWNNLGNLFYGKGRYDAAEDAYRKAIELNPHFASFWANLGMVLQDTRRLEEAENAYRKAVELAPSFASFHTSLGRFLHATKRFEEAEKAHRTAIDLDPNSAERWNDLGIVLQATRQVETATDAYRKAIELDSSIEWFWINLSNVLQETKQLEAAENACRKAIALNANRAMSWNNLGSVIAQRGDRLKDSEKAYRRALQLDPSFLMALGNLGMLLGNAPDRMEEAEAVFQKALKIDPLSAATWYRLGVFLANRTTKNKEAESAYRKAIELDSTNASVWGRLGELLERNLRFDEAREVLETAVLLDSKPSRWKSRLSNVIARDLARRGYAALINDGADGLRRVLTETLNDENDVPALLAAGSFRDELLIPALTDTEHAHVVLESMRDLGFEKHAKPLLLAIEAVIKKQPQAMDYLEPEVRSAVKRIYQLLVKSGNLAKQ